MNTDQKPGSVAGGMLLIAGCCIGAGMLGLPVLLGLCGFFPSVILLFATWIFMTYTGLLLIEVNGWFFEQVNIVSMAQRAIGNAGRIISWILYLFLFYSLLVAYISESGKLFISFLPFHVAQNFASIFFVVLFGLLVYFGTKLVDISNRFLMIGLIVTYLSMIFFGVTKVNFSMLTYVNIKYFLLPTAVLVTSFGFHNMIPSLVAYMKGDLKRTRLSIVGGSFISLLVYFFWILFVLGIVPVKGPDGLYEAFLKGNEATISLKNILKNSPITNFAGWFAFFAIVTSFLAQTLSLMHFIADGLKVKSNYKNNLWLICLAILPPTIFSLTFPNIFFEALGFAGAYCAVILFCILPVVMVWIGRYLKKETSNYHVRGGKVALLLVLVFSFVIILSQMIASF